MILYTMAATERDIELSCNYSGFYHNIICKKILLLLSKYHIEIVQTGKACANKITPGQHAHIGAE